MALQYWERLDWSFKRGDDAVCALRFTTTVDGAAQPLDLTGYTIRAQMRPGVESEEFWEFDTIVADPTTGTVMLRLHRDVTVALDTGTYRYDVEVTDPSDIRLTRVEGAVKVTADVTR